MEDAAPELHCQGTEGNDARKEAKANETNPPVDEEEERNMKKRNRSSIVTEKGGQITDGTGSRLRKQTHVNLRGRNKEKVSRTLFTKRTQRRGRADLSCSSWCPLVA